MVRDSQISMCDHNQSLLLLSLVGKRPTTKTGAYSPLFKFGRRDNREKANTICLKEKKKQNLKNKKKNKTLEKQCFH